MKKLLLFTTILFISFCGNKSKEKVYLPKMNFKRTKNPNYSNYFPGTQDTTNQNSKELTSSRNTNTPEAVPSFKPEPISNSIGNQYKTPGFFASLFSGSGSSNEESEERICEELLGINKTVLTEQTNKLLSLKNDKMTLLDEINNLEKQYQRNKTQNRKENQRLEKEIDRLNKLIKILASELK